MPANVFEKSPEQLEMLDRDHGVALTINFDRDHQAGLIMNTAYDNHELSAQNTRPEVRNDVVNNIGDTALWAYDQNVEIFSTPGSIASYVKRTKPSFENQRRNSRREKEIDDKTGLANEVAFTRARPAAEADPNVFMVVFDGDGFGQFNKRDDYDTGDEAVKATAETIELMADTFKCQRIFRLGGDEFVVLTNGKMSEEEAHQLKDYTVAFFSTKAFGENRTKISLSGGVGNTFKEADRDMQRNKAQKKGLKGFATKAKDFFKPGLSTKRPKIA